MKQIFFILTFLFTFGAMAQMPDTTRTPRKWYGPTIWTVYDTTSATWDTVGIFPGAATELWSSSGILDSGSVKTTGDTLWNGYYFGSGGSYIDDSVYIAVIGNESASYMNTGLFVSNLSSSVSLNAGNINLIGSGVNISINNLSFTGALSGLVDDASVVLTSGIYGWGEVYAYNGSTIDQWAEFIFNGDGTVYLKSNSTDVANTDTDSKLCIFDNGSGVTIRNRLGGARTIKYIIHY